MAIELKLLIALVVLIAVELWYFRLADKFNIIDKPNQRSSHTRPTIRGGGIIYPIALLLYGFLSDFDHPWFFAGALLIGLISFLDDLMTLSSKVRLPVQFISIFLMLWEADLDNYSLPVFFLGLVLAVGTINAYNFMDGINGITASYSFAILIPCLIVNEQIEFINPLFIYILLIANLVFSFFNFRIKARCFAGDVGSVSIAFALVFIVLKLVLTTDSPIFIFFFLIYGADSVLTIIHRIIRKENIFQAHRSHLYQYLANEMGHSHLKVSAGYGIAQLIISLLLIELSPQFNFQEQILIMLGFGLLMVAVYILWKRSILKKLAV